MHSAAANEPLLAAQHLLARLFHCHDARDFAQEVGCFTEDAGWLRKGETLQGRAAILRVLHARSPSLVTMHLVTNVIVDLPAADPAGDRADVRFFLTTYSQDEGTPPTGPLAPRALPSVGIGRATIRRDDGVWRISHLATDDWMFSAARAK
jgi:hypothetical protein